MTIRRSLAAGFLQLNNGLLEVWPFSVGAGWAGLGQWLPTVLDATQMLPVRPCCGACNVLYKYRGFEFVRQRKTIWPGRTWAVPRWVGLTKLLPGTFCTLWSCFGHAWLKISPLLLQVWRSTLVCEIWELSIMWWDQPALVQMRAI